ncbi:hypothetical protein QYE76_024369 [Lolium multiflorum]|uniref:Uncharacterized protein n=1 Tax=Lolium multiflorum TaxID=4521 RepID=A0AAD8REQ2_LOLMU|nr:hypothetical protein QYE76_024369 [Lolium multiflorum]
MAEDGTSPSLASWRFEVLGYIDYLGVMIIGCHFYADNLADDCMVHNFQGTTNILADSYMYQQGCSKVKNKEGHSGMNGTKSRTSLRHSALYEYCEALLEVSTIS